MNQLLLNKGQIEQCRKNVLKDSFPLFGPDQLREKVNLITCNFAGQKWQEYHLQEKTKFDIKSIITDYKSSINVSNGFPFDLESFNISIGILYNWGYILCTHSQFDHLLEEWYDILKETLEKANDMLRINQTIFLNFGYEIKMKPVDMVSFLLALLNDDYQALSTNCMSLAVLLSFHLLNTGKMHDMLPLFEKWKGLKPHTCHPNGLLLLGFGGCHIDEKILLEEILWILHSSLLVNYAVENGLEIILGSLDKVQNPALLNLKKLIRGCAFWRNKRYDDIMEECTINKMNTGIRDKIELIFMNLQGCVLSLQKQHDLAIQIFKECIDADFSYSIPLFNVASQYREKKMNDVELECLNLLVKTLECRKNNNKTTIEEPDNSLVSAIVKFLTSFFEPHLSLEEALYIFSHRCIVLKRYVVAAENYLKLIDLLKQKKTVNGNTLNGASILPSAEQIYTEAAFCLVKASRYKDAISVAENILSKYSSSFSSLDISSTSNNSMIKNTQQRMDQSINITTPFVSSAILQEQPEKRDSIEILTDIPSPLTIEEDFASNSLTFCNENKFSKLSDSYRHNKDCFNNKRPRSESDDESSTKYPIDMFVSVYLIIALTKLDNCDEALDVIDRTLETIETYKESKTAVSLAKKFKTDSISEANTTGQCKFGWNEKSRLYWNSKFLRLRASTLFKLGRRKEALLSSRLSIQSFPDNPYVWYDHVNLLKFLDRNHDAYTSWLLFRKEDTETNEEHLSARINTIMNKSRVDLSTHEEQFLEFDVESLEHLKSTYR